MTVDHRAKPTSKFEVTHNSGLGICLRYTLPIDRIVKRALLHRFVGLPNYTFHTETLHYISGFGPFPAAYRFTEDWGCIFDLSPFETVSWHQFSGYEPEKIVDHQGKLIEAERSHWVIAGFDAKQGEHFAVGFSHAARNEVATVQTRLNMCLELALEVARPFENAVRANFKNGVIEPTTPEDRELLADILSHWEKLRPDWDW